MEQRTDHHRDTTSLRCTKYPPTTHKATEDPRSCQNKTYLRETVSMQQATRSPWSNVQHSMQQGHPRAMVLHLAIQTPPLQGLQVDTAPGTASQCNCMKGVFQVTPPLGTLVCTGCSPACIPFTTAGGEPKPERLDIVATETKHREDPTSLSISPPPMRDASALFSNEQYVLWVCHARFFAALDIRKNAERRASSGLKE